jgi:hypothetical protein
VRGALIRYARWLRQNYEFPIRVPVYLLREENFKTIANEVVVASFFAPFDRSVEPFIKIATGDYTSLKQKRGRDNALAAYIISLSHEVIHYRQWIETGKTHERGVVEKALAMLRRYELTVDRP